MEIDAIRNDLRERADAKRALASRRYFKTGPGEYGEGDVFLGIRGPQLREIAKKHKEAGMKELAALLRSKVHEERQSALLILVEKYKKQKEKRGKIFDFYLANTKGINNWDLVDISAPKIVGMHLLERDRKILYKLVGSEKIWERRIAVLATFAFIRKDDFKDALRIAELLLQDKHDLIHKAVGWMLREVGKRDIVVLETFLRKHYKKMPRTMLRYAIERFPEKKRQTYLKG